MKTLRLNSISLLVMTAVGLASLQAHAGGLVVDGQDASAKGENSIAIGNNANADENSLAIGNKAKANYEKSVVIGNNAQLVQKSGGSAVAVGYYAVAAVQAVALGVNAEAQKNSAMALGYKAKAMKDRSIALGPDAQAKDEHGIAIGDQSVNHSKNSVILGYKSEVYKDGGIGIGDRVNVYGENSVAVGAKAMVSQNSNEGSAFGYAATVGAEHGTAIGSQAKVYGTGATVLGYDSKASGTKSIAIGNKTSVGSIGKPNQEGKNTIAIGNDITATVNDAVILGNSSTGVANAVSVGSDSTLRKIVYVANGAIAENSHDALTGGQLYSLLQDPLKLNGFSADKWKTALGIDDVADRTPPDDQGLHGTVEDITRSLGTGKVEKDNQNLVTGGTVFNAVDAKADKSDLDAKANTDADNINAKAWVDALSKDAEVKKGNDKLVTGDMVYQALQNVQPQQVDLSNLAKADASNIDRQAWRDKLGINDLEKTAYRGIAMGFAMNGLQHVPGKNTSVGVGLGHFKGHTAMAIGVRSNLNNPGLNVNLSLGYDMHKNVGVSTGLNIGW